MTDGVGEDAADYLLSESKNARILRERIVPQQMAEVAPQVQPVVVFLVGQPGAGKARASAMLADSLNARGGFVDVDSDLYKPYHPRYAELMARDDRLETPCPPNRGKTTPCPGGSVATRRGHRHVCPSRLPHQSAVTTIAVRRWVSVAR